MAESNKKTIIATITGLLLAIATVVGSFTDLFDKLFPDNRGDDTYTRWECKDSNCIQITTKDISRGFQTQVICQNQCKPKTYFRWFCENKKCISKEVSNSNSGYTSSSECENNCSTPPNADISFIGWRFDPPFPTNAKRFRKNQSYTAVFAIENNGPEKVKKLEVRYYTHKNGAPKLWKEDLENGEKKEFKYSFRYSNLYSSLETKITLDEFKKINDPNRSSNYWSYQVKVIN